MTIERVAEDAGVDVHFDREECELLVKLARDVAKVSFDEGGTPPSYFSVCLRLGQRIDAARYRRCPQGDQVSITLRDRMRNLILGDRDAQVVDS